MYIFFYLICLENKTEMAHTSHHIIVSWSTDNWCQRIRLRDDSDT
jgi:hypothetical protein